MLTSEEKSKSAKIVHFVVAVTFDINNIIQFCFDFLKDNRKIFDKYSVFFDEFKYSIKNGAPKMKNYLFFVFVFGASNFY